MLAEFLSEQGEWAQVMPGARACLFSLCERSFPLPLRLEPLHFEVLFCLAGMVTLTRRDGSVLRLGTRQVLLLTDISDLTDARVETGLKGVLVAVDARGARESLKTICDLLGGLALNTEQVRRWMASRGGCAVEGPSHWSQAAFADLDRLPQSERARWCVWKSVELLYLLSAPGEPAAEMVSGAGSGDDPDPGRNPPIYGGASGRTPLHLDLEPPRLPLCNDIQGGVPPPVRAAGPHLAAAAADGACGGAAAGLLPQRAGGGPISGIWQRQPVLRRLSPAVRHDAGHVSKNVRTGITLVRFGDTQEFIPSAIISQYAKGRVCFRDRRRSQ